MKVIRLLGPGVCAFIFLGVSAALAWVALTVDTDPLVRMPGTQPAEGAALEGPGRCLNCHGDYDPVVEPGSNWKGSMMAQAARDPIFWACFTVALQDSIWAIGTPNAGDLCERCHFPEGWLAGRSDPPNATLMTGSDYDGVHCDFCHAMVDPFYTTTYDGSREGADWPGYWDEAGNTGPGSDTLSQAMATDTLTSDTTTLSTNQFLNGDTFFTKFNVPHYPTYQENGSGQFFVSGDGKKRAGFADVNAKHQVLYSRYHKSKYFCSSCHDVSNPVLANLGLSPLPDQSGGMHQISEQYSAARYFHVERTFSEFMLSAYGQQAGAATNAEFAQLSGGINWVAKCQDCHMRDGVGFGCDKKGVPKRPTESTEHPNSGMPIHDMTGGNAWISYILASVDPDGPVYDPVNEQLLSQGPAAMTLDLTQGEGPDGNGAALKKGADRAKDQLRLAATIRNLTCDPYQGQVSFDIQNNTAHKLISGFPEGRRMFVNVQLLADDDLIYEINPYDYTAGTLKGLPHAHSSPALTANEAYVDELVYEVHPKSDLTGEDETFHFVLATGRYKDNRIPPKGFDVATAPQRLCEPVWHGVSDPDYFTSAEYDGGYDATTLTVPRGATSVTVTVYYQGTSREYIEFLRDEINGVGATLASPTPSGESSAYIIQTDPFFSQLRVWGDTIWQLWEHNHGLDGSGAAVAGIVPYAMTNATIQTGYTPLPGDCDRSGDVGIGDLALVAAHWLRLDCTEDNDFCDGVDTNASGRVDLADFDEVAENWGLTAQP